MKKKNQIVPTDGRRDVAFWDPFNAMKDFQSSFTDLFDRFWGRSPFVNMTHDMDGGSAWMPAVDVESTDKDYSFSVEVPGLSKEDVHVDVQDGVLKIAGERKTEKEEKKKNFLRKEQFYGTFSRSFSLPSDAKADGIQANYKDGILKVTVPRSEEAKPKRIDVKVS
ncbi:hypothetical protein BVX98_07370 [bacterium F11]|nr:hypothetical protein BVX98_07370 [bacterium F11]